MDQFVTSPPPLALPEWVARRPLTADEYERMSELGILSEDERVELIEGELIQMSPLGGDHMYSVNSLNHALVMAIGPRAVVSVQNPMRLNKLSEPQPDITVLKREAHRKQVPPVEGVLFVVEVAVSSLTYDRKIKLPLYAQNGIPEVLIVDVEARAIEVHRGPSEQGYAEVARFTPGQMISPQAFPDVRISVAEIVDEIA
jgi:Uma2 family endonuclease